jgi:hypothetical protein
MSKSKDADDGLAESVDRLITEQLDEADGPAWQLASELLDDTDADRERDPNCERERFGRYWKSWLAEDGGA